jgi:hypothetical protein
MTDSLLDGIANIEFQAVSVAVKVIIKLMGRNMRTTLKKIISSPTVYLERALCFQNVFSSIKVAQFFLIT